MPWRTRSATRIASSRLAAREQHDELVAAVARGDVVVLGVGDERVGDLAQHRVTGLVPVGVVDLLEVVDVEHEQADRRGQALRPRHLSLERLVEQPPVGEAGERVAGGQALVLTEQAGVAERERGVHRRLGQRPHRRGRDAGVVPTTPLAHRDAEVLAVGGDRA